MDAMSHFHVSVTYLEEEEYGTLLTERKLQLEERKHRDGTFGTALLSIHPDERAVLEDAGRTAAP